MAGIVSIRTEERNVAFRAVVVSLNRTEVVGLRKLIGRSSVNSRMDDGMTIEEGMAVGKLFTTLPDVESIEAAIV